MLLGCLALSVRTDLCLLFDVCCAPCDHDRSRTHQLPTLKRAPPFSLSSLQSSPQALTLLPPGSFYATLWGLCARGLSVLNANIVVGISELGKRTVVTKP